LSSKKHSILSDPPQYVSGVHRGEGVLQDNLYVDMDQIIRYGNNGLGMEGGLRQYPQFLLISFCRALEKLKF
jgi:hypothetical protein